MCREYFADKTPGIFVGTERSSLFISKYLQSGCSKWWVFLFCKLFHQASWGIVPKDLQCKRSQTSHWAPLLVSAGFVLALIWCRSHSSSKTTENKWTMWCVMCDVWCLMRDALWVMRDAWCVIWCVLGLVNQDRARFFFFFFNEFVYIMELKTIISLRINNQNHLNQVRKPLIQFRISDLVNRVVINKRKRTSSFGVFLVLVECWGIQINERTFKFCLGNPVK